MGTGENVNFNNSGKSFNINLDNSGDLEFRAGDQDRVRMIIYNEDVNKVHFNGSIDIVHAVTIGDTDWDGALQIRNSDNKDTIFVGSTESEAQALLGTNGRTGHVQLKDGKGNVNVDLVADDGVTGGGKLSVNADGIPTVVLDGRVLSGGKIVVTDATGVETIVLNGATGDITCKTINGKVPKTS
jgi:hypothetical protein